MYQGDEGGGLRGLGGFVNDHHPVAPELQVVQISSAGAGRRHHLHTFTYLVRVHAPSSAMLYSSMKGGKDG